MRPLLVGLAVSVALVSPMARAEAGVTTVLPTFADISWLSSPDAVKKQMASRAYTFDSAMESGDLLFFGNVSGVRAGVWMYFNDKGKLVKVAVFFSDSTRPYGIYKAIKPKLEEKYGVGKEYNTLKEYLKDSEYLVTDAIRRDTAKLITSWDNPNVFLSIEVAKSSSASDDPYCRIVYENNAWDAEYIRRSSKSDL